MVDTDDTRRTIHEGRRTTPGVWHKLPTGELKIVTLGMCHLVGTCQQPPYIENTPSGHQMTVWVAYNEYKYIS